ncbi:hypothetical protein BZA05DRAFT_408824 [Tricharina praecox]|uniref:uncharacterized protein n=1 Tax=Tricharina praecox TaxID=43433 RepID=UPI00221F87E8|nr:uncharacterized protein BZA05DRAFT_408824 [Tricharina praecox]KAI5844883.1 hypothetical protein BZA05DRAFT_408824 [Tricharina praecox]
MAGKRRNVWAHHTHRVHTHTHTERERAHTHGERKKEQQHGSCSPAPHTHSGLPDPTGRWMEWMDGWMEEGCRITSTTTSIKPFSFRVDGFGWFGWVGVGWGCSGLGESTHQLDPHVHIFTAQREQAIATGLHSIAVAVAVAAVAFGVAFGV